MAVFCHFLPVSNPRAVVTGFALCPYQLYLFTGHYLKLCAAIFKAGNGIDMSNWCIFVLTRTVYQLLFQTKLEAEIVTFADDARGKTCNLSGTAGKVDHSPVANN